LKNAQEAKIEVNTSFLRDEKGEKLDLLILSRKLSLKTSLHNLSWNFPNIILNL